MNEGSSVSSNSKPPIQNAATAGTTRPPVVDSRFAAVDTSNETQEEEISQQESLNEGITQAAISKSEVENLKKNTYSIDNNGGSSDFVTNPDHSYDFSHAGSRSNESISRNNTNSPSLMTENTTDEFESLDLLVTKRSSFTVPGSNLSHVALLCSSPDLSSETEKNRIFTCDEEGGFNYAEDENNYLKEKILNGRSTKIDVTDRTNNVTYQSEIHLSKDCNNKQLTNNDCATISMVGQVSNEVMSIGAADNGSDLSAESGSSNIISFTSQAEKLDVIISCGVTAEVIQGVDNSKAMVTKAEENANARLESPKKLKEFDSSPGKELNSFDLEKFMLKKKSFTVSTDAELIRDDDTSNIEVDEYEFSHLAANITVSIEEENSFWQACNQNDIPCSTPLESSTNLSRQNVSSESRVESDAVPRRTFEAASQSSGDAQTSEDEGEGNLGSEYHPSSSDNSSDEEDDRQQISRSRKNMSNQLNNETYVLNTEEDFPLRSARDDKDMFVARSKGPKGTDKKTFCMYCNKMISKFPIHLERKHSNIDNVKKFITLKKGTVERRRIIDTIRKNSHFFYNTCNQVNDGELLVCRRPFKERTAVDFTPCPNCKGFFTKNNIRHHAKKCYHYNGRDGRTVMVMGRKIAGRIHEEASDVLKKQVFPVLREDEIVRLIRYDRLLIIYGNKMSCKYRLQHQHDMIRAHLRLLGRFLKAIRDIDDEISDFASVYDPKYYDNAIQAVNKIAGLDTVSNTYRAPATAFSIGLLLKKVGDFFIADCIKQHNENAKKNTENFLLLHKNDYGISVNRTVAETQSQRKRRKDTELPSLSDIQKLTSFLREKQTSACESLKESFTYDAWLMLAETTLISVQLFNRRRAGEVERMSIEDFDNYKAIEKDALKSLSDTQQEIAKKYVRLTIRGKLMRTVPVLLSTHILECIRTLLNFRNHAAIPPENRFLFGLPSSEPNRYKYLRACILMKKFASMSGAKFPEKLRGTRLRKHVATHCINLDLSENEIADVANFMGHSDKIHRDYYRQPVASRDIVHIAKVLNTAQCGSQEEEDDEEDDDDQTETEQKHGYVRGDENSTVVDDSYQDDVNDTPSVPQSSALRSRKSRIRNRTAHFSHQNLPERSLSFQSSGGSGEMNSTASEANSFNVKREYTRKRQFESSSRNEGPPTKLKHKRKPSAQQKFDVSHLHDSLSGTGNKGKIKQRWNVQQTDAAFQLFKSHIKSGVLPSFSEIESGISKFPCLQDRCLPVVKSWVSNQIQKKIRKGV